tara:strand:- start:207 stop:707 length:501 start_codon:yes stop_codon:yes gene_type:complete
MDKLANLPNVKRDVELSKRMFMRNVPNKDVQMYFDPRAVQTRFQLFPCEDVRPHVNEPIIIADHYDTTQNFLPGDSAPFEGYSKKVEDESRLRNIMFPLQKGHQSKYIPSTTSDMYEVNVAGSSNKIENRHTLLFEEQVMPNIDRNPQNIATKNFFNHTRQQVKNL